MNSLNHADTPSPDSCLVYHSCDHCKWHTANEWWECQSEKSKGYIYIVVRHSFTNSCRQETNHLCWCFKMMCTPAVTFECEDHASVLSQSPFQICSSGTLQKVLNTQRASLTIMVVGYVACLCNHQFTAYFVAILFGVPFRLLIL